jgi:uncharacterized oxidoreductase
MTQTAVVTGGSSGIGLEIVSALARDGLRVLTCGSREKAPEAIGTLSGVEYQPCDLSTRSGCEALIGWVRSEAARLDFLFNNAGIQHECAIGPDLRAQDVEREIAINLTSPILLASALVPELEAAAGCVVNVSSGLALTPKARSPIYCATKAGLSSFSRTLRYQLSPRGIRVVDVITPLVRTPMTEGRNDGAMDPTEFCAQMLRGVRRGKPEVYVGKAKLLPPLLRIAPGLARRIMRDA